MKDIVLRSKHEEMGAKMVPFAGYNMPLQYSGLTDEHLAVRNNVGVFDVSHMGEFMLEGPDALKLIQKVTSNDASQLVPGKVQYSCFPNDKGGIVDDLLVYMLDEEKYMLVVNASNIDKDWDWINQQNEWNVSMKNVSDEMSLLAVQGPNATQAIAHLTDMDLASMAYYTVQQGTFAGVENVIVSTTGYTGAGGYEIYFSNENADQIFEAIFKDAANVGIKPAGLAARDTLRLEMGFCLYGNDIDDTTSPIEAGLGWITKFKKDFVNREMLENQKANGVTKKLVGFEMIDRGIPRQGYKIVNADDNEIGIVTSGTMSPSLKKGIGLGYVPKELSSVDSELYVSIRDKKIKCKVVKLPFYKA